MRINNVKQFVAIANQNNAPGMYHFVFNEVNVWAAWCRVYATYTRLCSIDQTPEFAEKFAQYIIRFWVGELAHNTDYIAITSYPEHNTPHRVFDKTQKDYTAELQIAETNPQDFIHAIYAWHEQTYKVKRSERIIIESDSMCFPFSNLYRLHSSLLYLRQTYSRRSLYVESSYHVQPLQSQLHVELNLTDYVNYVNTYGDGCNCFLYSGFALLRIKQLGGYAASVKLHDPERLRQLRSVIIFPYYIQRNGVTRSEELMGTQDLYQTHYLSCPNIDDAIAWIQVQRAENRLKPFIYRKQQEPDVFTLDNLHPYAYSFENQRLAHSKSGKLLHTALKRRLRVKQNARYARWV